MHLTLERASTRLLILLLTLLLTLLHPTHSQAPPAASSEPLSVDITSELAKQQQPTAPSSNAITQRLRGKLGPAMSEPHREVGVTNVNGRPVMYVEDKLGDEHDIHELREYGHLHKAAHFHSDGRNTFLHIQPVDHEPHNAQPDDSRALPDAELQAQQQAAADAEQQADAKPSLNRYTKRDYKSRYTDDDDDEVIVHGGHTHTRKDTEEHAGRILLIVLCSLAVTQGGIYYWKQRHSVSYDYAAIAGCWLAPMLYTIYHHLHNHRFVYIWLAFSGVAGYCLWAVRQKPLGKLTPRIVYGVSFVMFHACYAFALFGTVCIVLDLCGISLLLSMVLDLSIFPLSWWSIYFLLYGLYFGVLSRDFAQLATTRLSASIGYLIPKIASNGKLSHGSPRNHMPDKQLAVDVCALCGLQLDNGVEETNMLSCGHRFHEWCLKGWTLIGKRDTCLCAEKVDLSKFVDKPWEKPTLVWTRILDAVRWIIVFNPLVLLIAQWTLLLLY